MITNLEYKKTLNEIFNEIFLSGKYKFETNYSDIEKNNLGRILLNTIVYKEMRTNVKIKENLEHNSGANLKNEISNIVDNGLYNSNGIFLFSKFCKINLYLKMFKNFLFF